MNPLPPYSATLPSDLYRAQQVRALDRNAIDIQGIPGVELMERAGAAAFHLLRTRWPQAKLITVVCGIGNNGGDGYVLARLATKAGMAVRLLQLGESDRLRGDALSRASAFRSIDGEVEAYRGLPKQSDVIVDGLLGTGLERNLEGEWRSAVEAINSDPAPVLALDIPTGIHSDSGQVMGVALRAAVTISFIGLKQGLFTGDGPDYSGDVYFSSLDVPATTYEQETPSAVRIDWQQQCHRIGPRSRTAHKGQFGHLLVVGGELGFGGAARMAAEAGARSGAGLVSVASRPETVSQIATGRPELMCHGVESGDDLLPLLRRASVVAVGPGLGQSDWALSLLQRLFSSKLPMVVDADALNLLAIEPVYRNDWVLTPHPGEAARLLDCSTREIAADRFQAVMAIQEKYGGVVVLKGAGTLIAGNSGVPQLCSEGNPGMASGGMGDLLTGIIAALMTQGLDADAAAAMGVSLHGAAGNLAASEGERGMLATDLLPAIRRLINTEADC